MKLELRPIVRDRARVFVGQHHRHNGPPLGWMFGVGLFAGEELVGVGFASRPVARALDDGMTIELTRVCTLGQRNACSMIYGALCRAAAALGYHRAITYTLVEEGGASLRASGFREDASLGERPSWSCPSRPREQADMFGNERRPTGPKIRWRRDLVRTPADPGTIAP